MSIDYDAMQSVSKDVIEESTNNQTSEYISPSSRTPFLRESISKVQGFDNVKLRNVKRAAYVSEDGRKGYLFFESKAYYSGDMQRYWFAYRRTSLEFIEDCEEKYIVYACRDAKEVFRFPLSYLEDHLDAFNNTKDEDGVVKHWHIYIYREPSGEMKLMLSRPEPRRISMEEFRIK